MNYYIYCLQHYFDFGGRARRSEYWFYVLFNAIIAIIFGVVGFLIGGKTGYVVTVDIYGLAVLIPGVAVSVRRMHDIGKSGWWIFISLIPLIGAIWYLILACTDSQPGANIYGPNPKTGISTPPPFEG